MSNGTLTRFSMTWGDNQSYLRSSKAASSHDTPTRVAGSQYAFRFTFSLLTLLQKFPAYSQKDGAFRNYYSNSDTPNFYMSLYRHIPYKKDAGILKECHYGTLRYACMCSDFLNTYIFLSYLFYRY